MNHRIIRRAAYAPLAAALALLFAGCGSRTPALLLDRSVQAQKKQNGVKVDLDVDLDASGQLGIGSVTSELGLAVTGDIQSRLDEGESTESMSDLDMKLSYLGLALNTSLQSYTVKADDTHMTTYICQDGNWSKATSKVKSGEETAAETGAAEQLSGLAEQFSLSDNTEKVNQAECYRLTADLTLDEIQNSFSEGTSLIQSESGVDLDSLLAGKTFHVTYYIAKDTNLPVQAKVELSEEADGSTVTAMEEQTRTQAATEEQTTTQAAESAGEKSIPESGSETASSESTEGSSEDTSDLVFDRCDITLNFTWPDSVDITVPAEAETAQEK